jgi:radical SAM-linked protein
LSRFLSHLETIRLIDRAGRRAKLPIAYSGGFHPHPKISFGPALPVGVAGDNEYLDVELTEDWEPSRLVSTLNEHLHQGFQILDAIKVDSGAPAVEAIVDRHEYIVSFETHAISASLGSTGSLSELLQHRLSNGGWTIQRVTKEKRRSINAASCIADWDISTNNGNTDWRLTLVANDGRMVRPRELVESLFGDWPEGTVITRLRIGRLVDAQWVTPMELTGR